MNETNDINIKLKENKITLEEARIISNKYKSMIYGGEDDQIIESWSILISYFKNNTLFDVFIETFFNFKENKTFISEIKKLYQIFGDYFYKYLTELKQLNSLDEIISEMEARYIKLTNLHFTPAIKDN